MRLVDAERSRAVLVTTGHYRGLTDLPEVHGAAAALKDVLTSDGHGGFRKEHCFHITDPADPSAVAERILKIGAEATDTFLVYYAGHGLLALGENLHFACTETTPEAPHLRSLPVDWVHHALRSSPAANRLFIVDSCYSGRALRGTAMASPVGLATAELDVDDIAGRWTLTSAAETQASYILSGAPFSAFSGALVDVLRDGVPYRSELLTLEGVFSGVRKEMRAVGLPPPKVLGSDSSALLALVRNAAHVSDENERAGSLGPWWHGVEVDDGPANAGQVRSWITRRRQGGGTAASFFIPETYESFRRAWSPLLQVKHLYDSREDLAKRARANWGMRLGKAEMAAEGLRRVAEDDPRYAAAMMATCTRVVEPFVGRALKSIVADEPDLATAVLREMLTRFPAKCVRICKESDVSLPPDEWWHEQRLEPPR